MQIFNDIQHYGFWFLVILTVLVFVHELGHFTVARLCGVRVEVFSIGFGPELFGRTDRRGTRWKFSAIPLGGYVRMFGQGENMLEGEADIPLTPEEKAVSFKEKSVWRRMAIVVAGPAANFILAIVVTAGIYLALGQPHNDPVVDEVIANSAAQAAGVLPGDRIQALNGSSVDDFSDLALQVQLNLDRPLVLTILRGGQQITLTAQPRYEVVKDIFGHEQRVPRLGIQNNGSSITRTQVNPIEAVAAAGADTYTQVKVILISLWQTVTGARSSEDIGSVLRIAKMSGEVAQLGVLATIGFAVSISINLGLINLFPVPMLDGGHLVYYAIEAVRGRPLGERAQEWGLRVGLALILSLMVFATWNDLVYLKFFDYLKSLFT
ncbi:MAG TPA: RIP metalloprotease RseP [Dongiaceae bacterium]|jgi:regulator of sigma E protease